MTDLIDRYEPREFGGDYHEADAPKMRDNMAKVRAFLTSHPYVWFTKEEVRKGSGLPIGTDPTPRIRDLRKSAYGAWQIDMKRIDGQYRYRLRPHESEVV